MAELPVNLTALPIEAWLLSWLADDPGVRAVVSGRVYPVMVPAEQSLPAVVASRSGTTREYSLRGQSESVAATFQIECWAKSTAEGYLANCRAARAVVLALSGVRGDFPDGAGGIYAIERVAVQDERDAAEVSEFADEAQYFSRQLVVQVQYLEPVRNPVGG